MGLSKLSKVGCAIICVILLTQYGEALSCKKVQKQLSPCLKSLCYGGSVGGKCCYGVEKLIYEAGSEEDHKKMFCCIKHMASNTYKYNLNLEDIMSLIKKCNINVPYNLYNVPNCYKEY